MTIKSLLKRLAAVGPKGERCPTCASWPAANRLYIAEGEPVPSEQVCPNCGWRQPVLLARRYGNGCSLDDL